MTIRTTETTGRDPGQPEDRSLSPREQSDVGVRLLARHYNGARFLAAIEEDPRLELDPERLRSITERASGLSADDLIRELTGAAPLTRSLAVLCWSFARSHSPELTAMRKRLPEVLGDGEGGCELALLELCEIVNLRELSPPRMVEELWAGLERLLATAPCVKRDLIAAKYRLFLARQYRFMGDYECAIDNIDASVALCEGHDFLDLLQIQMLRGTLLYEIGDLHSALSIHEDPEIREICQSLAGGRMEAGFLVCAAKCRIDLEEYEVAEQRLRRAFRVLRTRCDGGADARVTECDARRFQAELLWRQGQHEQGMESLRIAENIATELDDETLLMRARTLRAQLLNEDESGRAGLEALIDLLRLGIEDEYYLRETRSAILDICEARSGVPADPDNGRIPARAQSPWIFNAALEALSRHEFEKHPDLASELADCALHAQPVLETSCREWLYADQLIDRSFS